MRVISAYTAVKSYIDAARSHSSQELEQLWWDLAVAPYWPEWAEGQFNEVAVSRK